jgi:hypothetical protein
MPSKAVVFLSHIDEEKEIAYEFKALIENAFLGMIDVFVSSNAQSVAMGQHWLDEVTRALKECRIEIILCSPRSVTKPWINFEAGAGWIRDIPVVPLCHSGMEPSRLPTPLNLLQGANLNDMPGLKLVFPVLANAIGANVPNIDLSEFVLKVQDFETRYTFWALCNKSFSVINSVDSRIIPGLRQGKTVTIELTETQINSIVAVMPHLENNDILHFEKVGNIKMSPSGVFQDYRFVPVQRTAAILADPKLSI